MILLGGIDTAIVLGDFGITPAQIASGGPNPSPLLNDVDPGDTLTELLWALLTPLVASGATQVTDAGDYRLLGAADGTYTQGYRLLQMPQTGAVPAPSESSIVTTVGNAAPSFTLQPTDQSVNAPGPATFSFAVASAASVQAQKRATSISAWANVSGASLTDYTTPATSITDNGAQFRFAATGLGGTVYSSIVNLSVVNARPALVNPVLFDDMLNRVLPYARTCPPQTAVFHLREASRDFFQRTLAWRSDLVQLLTVIGQADYGMVIPQETAVAKLLAYAINGKRVDVIDAEVGLMLQLEEAGTQIAWSEDRSVVSINPLPIDNTTTLDFRVALKPSDDSTAIPGAMSQHYLDNIVDGAIARILDMPGCDWSNPAAAATARGKYELAVARVSRMSAKGFSRPTTARINF